MKIFSPFQVLSESVDAGTQKIKPKLNHGSNLDKWIDGWLDERNASANPCNPEIHQSIFEPIMKTTRQFLLVAAVSALLGACSRTQTPEPLQTVIQPAPAAGAQKINCSGTVTDTAGNPVAGATVEYWRYEGNGFQPSEPELEKQITTGADGAFGFEVSRDTGFLLARKPGLAPAWKQLNQPFNPATETENKWC